MEKKIEALNILQRQGQSPSGPVLFEDVSLCWEAPSLHVIMGPSGQGKSTLLKTLGGVWRPLKGSLKISNKSLWLGEELQDLKLLSQMGFAFQNNALFSSLRVIENLLFPHRQRFPQVPESERKDLAQDWLKKVGLEASASVFPHELSGGMQKRLGLARTLILNPEFIFLDDPTAGLDPITSKIMSELISALLKGSNALVVIVTNDPDRARDWGPNIHFLVDKKLISPGAKNYSSLTGEFL